LRLGIVKPCVNAFGFRGSSVRNGRDGGYEARIHPLTTSIIAFAGENPAWLEGNPVKAKKEPRWKVPAVCFCNSGRSLADLQAESGVNKTPSGK
jgi:hypothetical protein